MAVKTRITGMGKTKDGARITTGTFKRRKE